MQPNYIKFDDKVRILFEKARIYPDFPKKGVNFVDFFSLISDAEIRYQLIDLCMEKICQKGSNKFNFNVIAGIELRGALLGSLLAQKLHMKFVAIRKINKLPGETLTSNYSTEYSNEAIQIQVDAFGINDRVLLVDDLLATGGTLNAAEELVQRTGAIVELMFCLGHFGVLDGPDKLKNKNKYFDLIKF